MDMKKRADALMCGLKKKQMRTLGRGSKKNVVRICFTRLFELIS